MDNKKIMNDASFLLKKGIIGKNDYQAIDNAVVLHEIQEEDLRIVTKNLKKAYDEGLCDNAILKYLSTVKVIRDGSGSVAVKQTTPTSHKVVDLKKSIDVVSSGDKTPVRHYIKKKILTDDGDKIAVNKLKCSIISLVYEIIFRSLLFILSLGLAGPWLIGGFVSFVYNSIELKDGYHIYLKPGDEGRLFGITLGYTLLGIITLGYFWFALTEVYIDYVMSHTIIEKNGIKYYSYVDRKSLSAGFVFSLIGHSILNIITLGFAIPFYLLSIVRYINGTFFLYRSEKDDDVYLDIHLVEFDNKNNFVKKVLIAQVLTVATLTFYSPYAFVDVINAVLEKTIIGKSE